MLSITKESKFPVFPTDACFGVGMVSLNGTLVSSLCLPPLTSSQNVVLTQPSSPTAPEMPSATSLGLLGGPQEVWQFVM